MLVYTGLIQYTYNVQVVKLAVKITRSDCAISMELSPLCSYIQALYNIHTMYNVHVVKLALKITRSDCAISMALFSLYSYIHYTGLMHTMYM